MPEGYEKFSKSYLPPNFYLGFIFSIILLFTSVVSYFTPYWVMSWSLANNPFIRLGLWEACFDGFILPTDSDATQYYGCYFLYAPSINKLWVWINPYWFISLQVLLTVSLIFTIVSVATLTLYFFNVCEERTNRVCVLGFCGGFHVLSAIFYLYSIIMFGIKSQDREWFPRPDQNILFISYWFACFNVIIAALAALFLLLLMKDERAQERAAAAEELLPQIPVFARDPLTGQPLLHGPDVPGSMGPPPAYGYVPQYDPNDYNAKYGGDMPPGVLGAPPGVLGMPEPVKGVLGDPMPGVLTVEPKMQMGTSAYPQAPAYMAGGYGAGMQSTGVLYAPGAGYAAGPPQSMGTLGQPVYTTGVYAAHAQFGQ